MLQIRRLTGNPLSRCPEWQKGYPTFRAPLQYLRGRKFPELFSQVEETGLLGSYPLQRIADQLRILLRDPIHKIFQKFFIVGHLLSHGAKLPVSQSAHDLDPKAKAPKYFLTLSLLPSA